MSLSGGTTLNEHSHGSHLELSPLSVILHLTDQRSTQFKKCILNG